MDTITHTLFGLTLYGAIDKRTIQPNLKKSLFAAALVGSQIPDIDVISSLTETGKVMSQMWHRGLTHSILLVPVWSLLIWWLCSLIWKRKDSSIFILSFIAVSIHIGTDALNTWGTGLFEPISSARISIGAIPIVDVVFLLSISLGWLVVLLVKRWPSHYILRIVWAVIAFHIFTQLVQVNVIKQQVSHKYEETVVSAGFIPTQFQVFGKKSGHVEILRASVINGSSLIQTLRSEDSMDLRPLFKGNRRAEVLYAWSPFVVVVSDENRFGIYDPRFFREGESFLAEYIKK
jgi:inner membrane protein